MKFSVTRILILLGVVVCLFLMMLVPKGCEFTETLGSIQLIPALALPILGVLSIRTRFRSQRFRALLSSDFIVSLIPIAIIIWACTSACFIRYPGHVFESDAKKISVGMTREQVIQTIGAFNLATGTPEEHWETLGYYIQRPIGFDRRKFHVRLRGGKVVSAEIRSGLSADDYTQ
jgi:amino acid transporter